MAGKTPPATKKMSKLVSFISQNNYDLYHVKGEDNAMADFFYLAHQSYVTAVTLSQNCRVWLKVMKMQYLLLHLDLLDWLKKLRLLD